MSIEDTENDLIKKHAPKWCKVLRLNSQEMLIEWDFGERQSFSQSDGGWWHMVRGAGFVINGISWWEDMRFRMDLVRRFTRSK